MVDEGVKNYPDPKDFVDKPQPQEALLLAYTEKVGESALVKRFFAWLNSQEGVIKTIEAKYNGKQKESVL